MRNGHSSNGEQRRSAEELAIELLEDPAWLARIAQHANGTIDPEDLVQETVVKLLEQPPRDPGAVHAWTSRVAGNTAAKQRRSDQRRRHREEVIARNEALPEASEDIELEEMQIEIARAVAELDEPFRSAILLRFFEGVSPSEIAERLDVPAVTVRSRIHRGIKKLRGMLEKRSGRDLLALLPWVLLGEARAAAAAGGAAAASEGATTATATTSGAASAPATANPTPWLSAGFASSARDTSARQIPAQARRVAMASCLVLAIGSLVLILAPSSKAPAIAIGGTAAPRSSAQSLGPLADTTVASLRYREVRGDDRRVLRGRVFDVRGRRLAGVWLGATSLRRATQDGLAGVEISARTRSRRDGSFEIDLPSSQPVPVALGDWATIRSSVAEHAQQDDAIVVVAPAVQTAGRVVDELGKSVGSARVSIDDQTWRSFPLALVDTVQIAYPAVRTSRDGRFAIHGLPGTRSLHLVASKPGFQRRGLYGAAKSRTDARIMIRAHHRWHEAVRGVVSDARGKPVAGARVGIGDSSTISDAQGNFALSKPQHTHRIVVAAPGFEVLDLPVRSREMQLRLRPARKFVARLAHPDSTPLRRALVSLGNPTRLGTDWFAEVEATTNEQRLAIPKRAFGPASAPTAVLARSDDEGHVACEGLRRRSSSRLRIHDPETHLILAEVEIGRGERERTIRIPRSEDLRGRVVDARGRAIAGARVRVTQSRMRRGKFIEHFVSRTETSDRNGRFSLPGVPAAACSVDVWARGFAWRRVELSPRKRSKRAALVLKLAERRYACFAGSGSMLKTAWFEDEFGKIVRPSAGTWNTPAFPILHKKSSTQDGLVWTLPATVRTLVIDHGDQQERRPIRLKAKGVHVIRL